MPSLSPIEWVLVTICAFLLGASKTGAVGASTLYVPLMATIFPARESTGILLPLLSIADIMGVMIYHHHARWRILWRVFPPAFVGIIIGYFCMREISNELLRPVIGGLVLLMLAMHFTMKDINAGERSHMVIAAGIGLLAGVFTMMANASGPIMILYLLFMRLDKTKFMGTIAWFYFVSNLSKIPFSAQLGLINPHSLQLNAVLLPAVLLGGWAGYAFVKYIPQRAFEIVMRVLAVASAVYLLV